MVSAGKAECPGLAPRGSVELECRIDGRPLMANVWIALTDTDDDHACMFAVPKARDAGYPGALADLGATGNGIALPAHAGTALVWDANVLHWGGN